MWAAILFALAVTLVFIPAWWRERRHRQERDRAQQDYTRKTLEQQQKAHAQFQSQQAALFNSMVEGVLLLDAHGRVELFNRSLQQLFRFAGDIREMSLLEAFRLHELDALYNRLLQEGKVQDFELVLGGIDRRAVQVNCSLLKDREGRHHGALFVFHDLTRLKQLENTRQEFVANVSHELRTPLSLIKGYVETLLDGAKDNPEVATRFLQTIEKQVDRLTFLIEDLLTISKLESGEVVLNLQTVDLPDFVQPVLESLQALAAEREVRLENALPPGLSASLDTDRMEQVFFNLLDNAIKYGRRGGRVVVGGNPSASGPELWIKDDGPGIPAEAAERIFERFYRVDRARSRETGGTGLGLSIVKHIVQSHGGKVWVKSRPGQGSAFYFTLPAEIPAAPPTPSLAPAAVGQANGRI